MSKHRQASLFDDAPAAPMSVARALGQHKPADKQQAAFQRLLRQVEEQRSLLTDWNTYLSRYHQRIASELLPLHDKVRAARRSIVLLLDTHWENRVLKGKAQQTQLKTLLLELLDILLEEKADDELDALYKKHRNISFAEEKAAELLEKRTILENAFGVPLDDLDDTDNLDDLIRQVQKKLTGESMENDVEDDADTAPAPKKRKTAKQEAAELKKEAAAKTISQTVRAVYRKLASALHPDRETDAAVREKKTEQMQRVNQAYEAGDLLALLNLQFEIEQIDTDHLASLPAERLTHYNEVLREQLAELKAEVEAVITPFKLLCPWQRKLAPQHVDREINAEIIRIQMDIQNINNDLERLQNPAELKRFLDEVMSEAEYLDEQMLEEIFLDTIILPPTPGKKGKKKPTSRR